MLGLREIYIRDCAGKRRKMEWERSHLREGDGMVGE